MPKAEVGSTRYLNNKLKSKGLQRLRWYCQVCEKQCRDENGFKMHTQSESHVRQMLAVGADPKKYLNEYSNQFLRDFLQLLRTGHGEKQVQINHFYQEYIANKEHVHMNATKWPSLTEFAKHLGREGICRVEETEKGIHISWIDNSPEALKRQEALRRKEAQDRGNEEVEQMMIREQIKRAQKQAEARGEKVVDEEVRDRGLQRAEGEKISLSFGAKKDAVRDETKSASPDGEKPATPAEPTETPKPTAEKQPEKPTGGISLKMTAKPQTKNVFAQAKKKALAGGSKKTTIEQPKKMSETERIMKEDMERMEKKRGREGSGFGGFSFKKQKKDQR
ncbi:KIN17-like protein [Colletotrichum orbiculare MAFF 240422]|uniref:KIN17-like protein n=1 Tax=Colletotrichum orbiculare (strain 104-T / ATCC 96160 / CBS 514.97 / LARS 414 / MAFF 240422) TaxID=1213857 RepID=N4V902_COLOR|nr:KIN17-like protein [Colletotrichum orbiculare MAFF 240422]